MAGEYWTSEADRHAEFNRKLGFILLAGVVLLVVYATLSSSQNRAAMPSLLANLGSAKSLCESRASAAIDAAAQGRIHPGNMEVGRRLYDETKAEFDGCIDYLHGGLSNGFGPAAAAQAAALLAASKHRADEFTGWANGQLRPTSFESFDPFDAAIELLNSWLDRVSREDAQAIERMKADLERCRLRDWRNLGG